MSKEINEFCMKIHFTQNHFGVWLQSLAYILRIASVNKVHLNALTSHYFIKQLIGAAVNVHAGY